MTNNIYIADSIYIGLDTYFVYVFNIYSKTTKKLYIPIYVVFYIILVVRFFKHNGVEVSNVYSDEIFFFFINLICLNFNNNRCKIRPTLINAISCSKPQKLTRNSLTLS